ncbi:HRDC domain-containing protein [Microbacterium sp. SORGH_AS_0888]|uniref:HRDC domain-containing protein n=1 Tax=Microbacterium sp. SORGH_AS_0888 TaxID=3041791 RepID=UPI0027861A8A|nr:HRDC domain-containing protein [Microbacterium sp. SORGH_AS_0888]MDQ1128568.1 ribonuclease D [Microbacterium sp. SORGH_AS_0888]
MTDYQVIADERALLDAMAALAAGTGPFAVDVERASGFRYSQRAYLVQIWREGAGVLLFDAPALANMDRLQPILSQEEWILHAASQDLPSLRELGLEPPRIFDTELAARLLGHERVGLAAVVERALGITLAKEHSAADWSTRPLPDSWLEYAALDVVYLRDVRDAQVAELEEQHKTEIAAQEFQAVIDRPVKPVRTDPWRRLSGLHTLRGRRAYAVARELWTAREELARETDVAPGRLVPDRALVAAIAASPQSKRDLAANKLFIGRASRSELDRWWAAIERGRTTEDLPPERVPSDTLPPPRAWVDRNPEADARLKAARPRVEERAAALSMPTENLLTPELLRRLAWTPPEPTDADTISDALSAAGARPWQIHETAQLIADAFVASVQTVESDVDAVS